ncbi:MAG: MFS transporter [Prevotella sp.]|nr:MFS transporter [Prevotella sp.]
MNTQNTPVHVRLWHRDFWLLAISNMLLSVAVYMLIPTLPVWLAQEENFSPLEVGLSMGVFAAGLFLFGAFCSWLVQRYRRNHVCIWAIIGMTASIAVLYYVESLHSQFVEFWVILLQRLLLGATFGLAQMVLSSTLIIDVCESDKRTEANHSAAWFSRFALSLGPFAGLVLSRNLGFDAVLLGSIGCTVVAVVLILIVDFPFRTPSDTLRVVSLDRFFLTGSMPLFLNLLLIGVSVGMLLALTLSFRFYGLVMVGFLLALLAQRFVFREAELKSEIVTGLILLLAVQLMAYTRPLPVVWYVGPVLLGLSVGIICSRFLLFFIKLSRHCQRGTSQSTCFLGWESGLALGLGLGYALFPADNDALLVTSLVFAITALLLYNYFVHKWFIQHKNR